MYSLAFDSARGIVRMTVSGFWDVATVAAWTAEMKPLLIQAKERAGKVLVLSDARNFPVQSLEVGEAFGRTEAETGALRDKLAMVVTSALSKMQGQRAVAGSTTAFFTTIEDAEAWLLEG